MNYQIAGIEPSPIDLRDYPYISPFTPEQLVDLVDLRDSIFEVENQLSIGSCVANGICSQCEQITKSHQVESDLSRMFLYNATKNFEGRLGQEGLYTRNAYKVAAKYGICQEADYPYDLTLDNKDPEEQFYRLASDSRVERFEAVASSGVTYGTSDDLIHRIRSALQEGLPVGTAMPVTTSMEGLKGAWFTHKYDSTARIIGGHYFVLVGAMLSRKMFIALNSWGTEYGDNGYMGLPFSIVENPFFEAYVVRRFKGLGVAESPGIRRSFLNRFRLSARIVPEKEEIGKKVNIWMGAIVEGQALLRQPIPMDKLDSPTSSLSEVYDNWESTSMGFRPVVSGYELKETNPIQVVRWRDMQPFAGADIYVGYGESDNLQDAKIEKVCTVPAGLV